MDNGFIISGMLSYVIHVQYTIKTEKCATILARFTFPLHSLGTKVIKEVRIVQKYSYVFIVSLEAMKREYFFPRRVKHSQLVFAIRGRVFTTGGIIAHDTLLGIISPVAVYDIIYN